jgi:hypothetical protein
VAVHSAEAEQGLLVTSVIAAPEVAPALVIDAAHELARADVLTGLAGEAMHRVSLFDLPLGESDSWDITEEVTRADPRRRSRERYESVLPAWSAESTHDLAHPSTGCGYAAEALAAALGLTDWRFAAAQSAKARYGPTGFEAAAVTAIGVATAAFAPPEELRCRAASLRFGHPYAVVASVVDPGGPWHSIPVFSAWVSDPEEAIPEGD